MEYTVRSTYTKARSRARRAADIAVILLICLALVFALFKLILVPVSVSGSRVCDIADGELILVDRVSKFVSDYSEGDIVRVNRGRGFELLRVAAGGGSDYTVRGGRTYLNGCLIDESGYASEWGGETEFSVSVPEDSLLLLPDNREGITSLEEYTIRYAAVYGEVRLRIHPLSRLNLFI